MTRVSPSTRSPTHRFALRTIRVHDRLSIQVKGGLVQSSVHHLEETFVSMAAPNDDIQIDLTGISQVDEKGLETLLRVGTRADFLGARITLSGLPSRLRRMVELYDSTSVFTYAEENGIVGLFLQRGSRGQRE